MRTRITVIAPSPMENPKQPRIPTVNAILVPPEGGTFRITPTEDGSVVTMQDGTKSRILGALKIELDDPLARLK
jgi:hypothetical protein